jgi:TonB family protein
VKNFLLLTFAISAACLLLFPPRVVVSQQTTPPPIASPGEDPVLKVGGSVTAPTIASKVDPQYSEVARKAGIGGMVRMEAIVQKDGSVQIVRIVRGVGFGLDENAVEALRQWKFHPATQSGAPVRVALNIETNFNLARNNLQIADENRVVDAASGKLVPGQYSYIYCGSDPAQSDVPFTSASTTAPKQLRCGARVIFLRFDQGTAQVKLDDPFEDAANGAEGFVAGMFVSGVPRK